MKRRLATSLSALLAAVTAGAAPSPHETMIAEACPAHARATPDRERRILVFNRCWGFKHEAIPTGATAIRMMGEKTGAYAVDITDDPEAISTDNLKHYDGLVLNNCTSGKAPDEMVEIIRNYVKAGGGLIGIHAATDGKFGEVVGGLFSGHPWHEDVGIKLDDPAHPLSRCFGGKDFRIKDEIYQFNKGVYSRDNVRVLLSLDMNATKPKGKRADNDYAVAWIKELGEGRIFYCSLGHRHEIFWNPLVLQFYLDGIQYALGDIDADATPTSR